jgi:hypothetical protein
MRSIEKCAVPQNSFLSAYLIDGTYVDSYRTEIHGLVSLPVFVLAFYTTTLFKIEQLILKYIAKRPSSDIQAQELANGIRNQFAAWSVESRNENELLMCDMLGRTRSWFMVAHHEEETQLYFGSAVVPVTNPKTGKSSLGFVYHALLGFHKIYSFLLLYFASRNVPNFK